MNHSEASPGKASQRGASLVGRITAPDPVPVIAPVAGAVVTVSVDEGTAVKAGEVLAVLAHDDTELVAPVSGVVVRRSINRGSVVRPDGAAAFLILPDAPLRLVVEVDRKTSRALRASSIASFVLEGDREHAFKARFSAVRTESTSKGTPRYLAQFDTEGSGVKLSSGMTVAVFLPR